MSRKVMMKVEQRNHHQNKDSVLDAVKKCPPTQYGKGISKW